MERAAERVEAGQLTDGDTIYLTTADKDGNMVSLIQSNYRGMGAGVRFHRPDAGMCTLLSRAAISAVERPMAVILQLAVPGLGFGFQDRGEMFNVMNRSHANAYEPGKRPFHTIIPAFAMKDDKPWLSFGVMGGDMCADQPTWVSSGERR